MCGLNTKLNRLCNSKHLVENSNIKQREKTVLYFIFSWFYFFLKFCKNTFYLKYFAVFDKNKTRFECQG